jgi:hypothetical protein
MEVYAMLLKARIAFVMAVIAASVPIAVAGPAYADRPDRDNDGLYDDDEVEVYSTNPNIADTDGDGSDDGQEVYDGTDPVVPNGGPQPTPTPTPIPTPTPGPIPTPTSQVQRTAVFEITGNGTVYSIDFDPAGAPVRENTAVPFTRTLKIGSDVAVLTVNAVTKTGSQGCRITLDGKVVAEQPQGNAFCQFSIPN